MLLFASYLILFPLFLNSGTVELFIRLNASSFVFSTKSSVPIPFQRLVNGRKTLVKMKHADDRPNGKTQN